MEINNILFSYYKMWSGDHLPFLISILLNLQRMVLLLLSCACINFYANGLSVEKNHGPDSKNSCIDRRFAERVSHVQAT